MLLALEPAIAAAVEVSVERAECLPIEHNAVLYAQVSPQLVGGSVRLYFRRLHPKATAAAGANAKEEASARATAGELYWVEMHPLGDGDHWTVFPKPEDRAQRLLSDAWWADLEDRDWMRDRGWMEEEACREAEAEADRRRCLEEWLERQENEAAEYYVAVHDERGELVERSEMYLVEVNDDCKVRLNARQNGWADNLIVGETVPEQWGERLFHWLCEGVTSRVDWQGIPRPDDFCRKCVIGYLPGAGGDRPG